MHEGAKNMPVLGRRRRSEEKHRACLYRLACLHSLWQRLLERLRVCACVRVCRWVRACAVLHTYLCAPLRAYDRACVCASGRVPLHAGRVSACVRA